MSYVATRIGRSAWGFQEAGAVHFTPAAVPSAAAAAAAAAISRRISPNLIGLIGKTSFREESATSIMPCGSRARPQQNFSRARTRCLREGPARAGKREFSREEPPDVDPAAAQEIERRLEAPATASDDGHFVDDERSRVEPSRRVIRGLPNDRAAGAYELNRPSDAVGRTGGFDHEIEGAPAGAAPAFDERDVRARVLQHSRAERSELSGAEHRCPRLSVDRDLVQDLAGRGQRLGEDRLLVGDLVRHLVQVVLGESQVLGVRARVPEDAEHAASGAVTSEAAPAPIAAPAGEVDLPDDALAHPRRARGSLDAADELMAGNAREAVVAAPELQVGVADARRDDAHERETPLGNRSPDIADPCPTAFEKERLHVALVPATMLMGFQVSGLRSQVSRRRQPLRPETR